MLARRERRKDRQHQNGFALLLIWYGSSSSCGDYCCCHREAVVVVVVSRQSPPKQSHREEPPPHQRGRYFRGQHCHFVCFGGWTAPCQEVIAWQLVVLAKSLLLLFSKLLFLLPPIRKTMLLCWCSVPLLFGRWRRTLWCTGDSCPLFRSRCAATAAAALVDRY